MKPIKSSPPKGLGRLGSFARLFLLSLGCAFASSTTALADPAFLPTPQKITWQGTASVAKSFSIEADGSVPGSTLREYRRNLRKWGLKSADGGLEITLKRLPVPECEKVATPPYQKKNFLEWTSLQTYFLKTGDGTADIKACGEDGFFYALMTLKHLLEISADKALLYKADIVDYPAFPVRGVMEGGYGSWDRDSRLDVIDWMGDTKLNSYLYGPKGDAKMRRRWREPYDDIELFNFKLLMEKCRENHVQFGYAIGPSLGFEYGSDEDFATLLNKLRPLQALGMKTFAIEFDDTLGMLYSPRDREKFASLAEAEAFVTNKLNGALKKYDPEVVVVMVPEIYANVYPAMDYEKTLAAKLSPEICIGWTGTEIGSPSLDGNDVQKFIDFFKRAPSFGDNWGSLFPMLARNAGLHKYMTQFMSNPFNLQGEVPIPGVKAVPEAQLMPVQGASISDFAWNPEAYDAEKTLDTAARMYIDEAARDIFKTLVYKDWYDFLAYYFKINTDYLTPFEKAPVQYLKDGDDKALADFVAKTLPLVDRMADAPALITAGCTNPGMAARLAKRASDWKPYFAALSAELKKIKDAQDKKDAAQTAQAVKNYLKALREEK